MIKTPQTHPDHHTVGHYFGGHSLETNTTEVYYCDSYDPAIGYWLTNARNPAERKNVSERAIGRTFHEADDMGAYWYIPQWGVRVIKTAEESEATQ